MTRDYFDQLLELAADIVVLVDAERTLDKRDWKKAKEQHDGLEAKFKEVRNKYVDALLGTPEGHAEAYELVVDDIEQIKATCDPSWLPAVNYTSDSLLPYLKKESGRNPRTRKAIKSAPWVLAGIGAITYFGIRFWSATPISHTIETKEGIQERAAAIAKLLRYDEWMQTHVRKGGWLKGILFWPIEPNEEEIKGAGEFAGLAYEAQKISVERFDCLAIPRGHGERPSKEELDYLQKTAEYLRGSNVKWSATPVFAVVDAAKAVGKC
ncbi:hypothetical protein [Sphingomonas colocasiae]|uniref:Uncharacterized protein n=1 Tax=Sphingomonas colocasiae TaxID=1848973 RepID=A0ABS7PUF2_9SPHN|nr:hypothetical protein [Sphingomonas colocasiae]MBY8824981.1 hypothetical protein [Sphingomonas colocasiae]